jgi:hypothetical protein
MRAKNQIHREASWRSFLLLGLALAAVLRLFGIELPVLYLLLLLMLLISLLLTSDLGINIRTVSKKGLVSLLEDQLHNDPYALTRCAQVKESHWASVPCE